MYCQPNFKTKKALREAVDAGQRVTIFQPGPFSYDTTHKTGEDFLQGPHFPEPHRWYAKVYVTNGLVTKVFK